MTDGRQLLERHLNGEELSDPERASLSAWVCASAENTRLAVHLTHLDSTIGELTRSQSFVDLLDLEHYTGVFEKVEPQPQPVRQAPRSANPEPTGVRRSGAPQARDSSADLSFRQFGGVLGYLVRRMLVRMLASRPVQVGLVGAVILIVVLLAIPKGGDTDSPRHRQHVEQSPRPPASVNVVATLTAEVDARWDVDAAARPPGRGDALEAGQTLKLAAGYAEITTRQGARVVLEAPCTVQMLDDDNALRLVEGKLVGRVDAEHARGLLVRTPHMDVIDLGTEFGIDATRPGVTEVHVLAGEVEVTRVGDGSSEPTRLRLGTHEAARAVRGRGGLARIEPSPQSFDAIATPVLGVHGSGQGLALGDEAPGWLITAVDDRPLQTPLVPQVYDGVVTDHVANDPATSQWIGINAISEPSGLQHRHYTFETRITLPISIDPDTAGVRLWFLADNQLVGVRVNGHDIAVPANELSEHRGDLLSITIDRGLQRGINTVTFLVRDNAGFTQPQNRVGLNVRWEVLPNHTP